MQTFEWVDAASVQHAAQLLAANTPDRPVVAKAGGIDLLDLMKDNPEGVGFRNRFPNLEVLSPVAFLHKLAVLKPGNPQAG